MLVNYTTYIVKTQPEQRLTYSLEAPEEEEIARVVELRRARLQEVFNAPVEVAKE